MGLKLLPCHKYFLQQIAKNKKPVCILPPLYLYKTNYKALQSLLDKSLMDNIKEVKHETIRN